MSADHQLTPYLKQLRLSGVLATLDLVGAGRMVVSDWGLREGILLSLCS